MSPFEYARRIAVFAVEEAQNDYVGLFEMFDEMTDEIADEVCDELGGIAGRVSRMGEDL